MQAALVLSEEEKKVSHMFRGIYSAFRLYSCGPIAPLPLLVDQCGPTRYTITNIYRIAGTMIEKRNKNAISKLNCRDGDGSVEN